MVAHPHDRVAEWKLQLLPLASIKREHVPHITAAAKSLQSCPTLCDPIYGIPPGSPVPGILQARTLEWVAISFLYHKLEGSRGDFPHSRAPRLPFSFVLINSRFKSAHTWVITKASLPLVFHLFVH